MREQSIDLVLRALTAADPLAHDGLARAIRETDAVIAPALAALLSCWLGDGEAAATSAADALVAAASEPNDREGLAFARAIAGLAIAHGAPVSARLGDPIAATLAEPPPTSAVGDATAALLIEAALGCARLDLALALQARSPLPRALFGRDDHPFLVFVRCTHARTLLFAGDVTSARPLIADAVADARTPVVAAFARSCAAMLSAVADQRAATRGAVRAIEAVEVVPSHLLASGVYVIAAYAAISQNDAEAAARLILAAAARGDLSDLRIIDRVIGIELLVRAALDAGEVDVARGWVDQVAALSEHPIVDSTVARITSRLMLAQGDAAGALTVAERAVTLAHRNGRGIEAAEGEIVAARARVAAGRSGPAARRLTEVADQADARGYRAVRLSADRELRSTGRRLPPPAQSEWAGLSAREREVASLLVAGASNAAIGAQLHLSAHTVRMHVSRALHAFGAPTRAALAARVADQHPLAETKSLGELTDRQKVIAGRIADGLSNAQIAADLGVGVFTVDKHVTAILRRWDLPSRAAIAAAVTGAQ